MRTTGFLLFVFLLLFSTASSAQSRVIADRVSVLTSSDTSRGVSKRRVVSCIQQILQEWHLSESSVPNIVIINASSHAAAAANATDKITIRVISAPGPDTHYFEMWLLDTATVSDAVLGVENILERQFELKLSDKDRDAIVARVTRMQASTVNVDEGR